MLEGKKEISSVYESLPPGRKRLGQRCQLDGCLNTLDGCKPLNFRLISYAGRVTMTENMIDVLGPEWEGKHAAWVMLMAP